MADVTVNETSTDPNEHYSCGFRAMVLGDYATAIAAFGRCCELKAAAVGDQDDSLGETYYFYGKCLLESCREEHHELGDAIPNEDDEDGEEGEEEEGEAGAEAENEENEAENDNDANEAKDAAAVASTSENSKNGTTTNGETTNGDGDADDKPEADSTEGGEAAGSSTDGAAEEATDLQLAWEVLEVAKLIFENRGDVAKEKLADTLILLGEVALESEDFENGILDIQHGLEIHKSVYENDNRKLAESYYKLGMAMLTCSRYDEAAENFKNSLNILRNVVSRLETAADKNSDMVKAEIEEVKALIPEIEEKITDTQTYKKEAISALMSSLTDAAPKTDGGASSSSSKPTDISHLVKRKRKVEEGEAESTSDANPAKKPSP